MFFSPFSLLPSRSPAAAATAASPLILVFDGNNKTHQMVEFVSNYRRAPNINGKLSYSNLYTSISVLAGHYASYGPKFPVPEKRRKRLLQV